MNQMSKPDKLLWILSLKPWVTELADKPLSMSSEIKLYNWVNQDIHFNRATKVCKLLVDKHRELRLAGCQSPARTAQRLLVDALQIIC